MMIENSIAVCVNDIEDISMGTICILNTEEGLSVLPENTDDEYELNFKELSKHFLVIDDFVNLDIKLIDEYSNTIFGNPKPIYSFYIIPSHICLRHYDNSKKANNKNNFIDLPIEDIYDDFDIDTFYHGQIYSKLFFINLVDPDFFIPYSYELVDWFKLLPDLIIPNKSKFLNSMDYQKYYTDLLKSLAHFVNQLFCKFIDFLQSNGFKLKYKEGLPPNEQEGLKYNLYKSLETIKLCHKI